LLGKDRGHGNGACLQKSRIAHCRRDSYRS
jgi:hypothetical protein